MAWSPDDTVRPPDLRCDAVPDSEFSPDRLATDLDDATIAYVMAARPAFDGLRKAEGQLAGVLVLAAAGGRSAAGHPMLALAWQAWAEAAEAIGELSVPAPGRHHYHHLRRAAACIGRAVGTSRRLSERSDAVVDAVLRPLRAAHQELQWAAGALPGFEMVAFSQGCCASHPATRIPRGAARNLIKATG